MTDSLNTSYSVLAVSLLVTEFCTSIELLISGVQPAVAIVNLR